MHILDQIIRQKRKEVRIKKDFCPVGNLKNIGFYQSEVNSLKSSINQQNNVPIIAEYKRRSPSKAIINNAISITDVAETYQNTKFCAMSILTDQQFFGGSLEDLMLAKSKFSNPILRKDFIIEPYQIHEAKAFGADVILLIASVLKISELKHLYKIAIDLGLEVLVEIHTIQELEKVLKIDADIIGINNRNLKTFEVDIKNSIALSYQIPKGKIKVSESGISNSETIKLLKNEGFDAFLIGENFMKSSPDNFAQNCSDFIQKLSK
ncbi:MAG: indole-3-glycerol phosphate synthase TrpC [Lactococcus lactis]|nr:indole-3-glycerol phosphate synthase TrpC [Lactococcus lactis]